MREAASDLLVFVDDDTLLDRDYLARAVEIKQEWPLLGIWGSGEVTAEYEVQPDESLVKLLPYLAIRQTEKPLWSNVAPCVEATPWGAGSCVRASVAEEYRRTNGGSEISITGRRGNALLSGEDRDIAYVACQMGLGTAVFPELRVTHVIPKHRISRKYLLKVYEGTEISDALLMYKWKGHMPMSPFRTRGLLSIMKIFLVRRGLDRQMHLAKVRAMISARQIIAAEKP